MSAANPYSHEPQRLTRLNIGAGQSELPGFTSLDIKQGQECTRLEYHDNSVDEIYASHVLEHWPYEQTVAVLREWSRVLKPGGKMRLSVPDFDALVREYSKGTTLPIEQMILGGHTDENDYHQAIFTRDKLTQAMRLAGLRGIMRWESQNEDCSAYRISLNLEGRKRIANEPKGVVMTMTLPRLCFSDNMFCCMAAVIGLKVPILRSTGVYWSHGMTQVFNDAIAGGAKYICHIDYDSVFTAEDVVDLYAIMEERPDIDALCALQIHREKQTPLMAISDGSGNLRRSIEKTAFLDETMRIEAGHFGLTMLRADKVAALPQPWFCGDPGPNNWGDGRVDDDIWFWKQWRGAGNSVYSANCVTIGHIQRVITWPSRTRQAVHQYMNDYGDAGKPLEAI